MAASICFFSARDSFLLAFTGGVCLPSLSACRFFFAVNNVIHLLVELFLPLQHGIEVVCLIRALFWPNHGNLNDIADDLFQGLTVLLIHCQHEEGQHDQHHAHSRHTASRRLPEQKEKRYADKRSAAETDQLPLG